MSNQPDEPEDWMWKQDAELEGSLTVPWEDLVVDQPDDGVPDRVWIGRASLEIAQRNGSSTFYLERADGLIDIEFTRTSLADQRVADMTAERDEIVNAVLSRVGKRWRSMPIEAAGNVEINGPTAAIVADVPGAALVAVKLALDKQVADMKAAMIAVVQTSWRTQAQSDFVAALVKALEAVEIPK